MTDAVLHAACIGTTGSEHYEAVVSTGTRYAIPRHGDRVRWDWGATLRSLDFALQRHTRAKATVAEMTPAQREALWGETGPDVDYLRRVASR